MQWNAEQADFIARPLGHGVLMGIPGGGKTRSIIGRVRRLVADGEIPPHGFVILTFSRIACKDFIRKGSGSGDDGLFHGRNVRTLHSLAGHVMAMSGASTNCMIQTVVSRATSAIRGDQELLSRVEMLRDVRAIVVDEAQDISGTQYAFVMTVAARLGAGVVMVGDPNQSIYGFQGGDPRFLLEHPGWRVHLRVNYRSTQAIVDVVNACRPYRCDAPMLATHEASAEEKRPVLHHCANENEITAALVSALRVPGALRSCAVVAPTKRSYKDGALKNVGVQLAANVLHQNDIPFEIHYDETKESAERARRDDAVAFRPGRVHLLTVHGSKGLEFDDVYVLNFHHWTYGFQPDEDLESTYRYMWYVALSRARSRLTCFCWTRRVVWPVDGASGLFDVIGHPNEKDPSLNPKIQRPKTAAWTELLNDRVALPEETLCTLESGLLRSVALDLHAPHEAVDVSRLRLPEFSHVASLYGKWAEAWFEACYVRGEPTCMRTIRVMVDACVTVCGSLAAATHVVRRACGKPLSAPFSMEEVRAADVQGDENAAKKEELVQYLESVLPALQPGTTHFHIHCVNRCQWFNTDKLRNVLREWESRSHALTVADVWRMNFFLWQYDCEARYRYVGDMPKHCAVVRALRTHAAHVRQWAESLGPGWTFQVPCRWEGIVREPTIVGVIDAINVSRRAVMELKFSPGGLQPIHAMQVAGYAHMHNGLARVDADWELAVWNLYDGTRHVVHTQFPVGGEVLAALSSSEAR